MRRYAHVSCVFDVRWPWLFIFWTKNWHTVLVLRVFRFWVRNP